MSWNSTNTRECLTQLLKNEMSDEEIQSIVKECKIKKSISSKAFKRLMGF